MSPSEPEARGPVAAATILAALLALHTLIVVGPFVTGSAAVDYFTFWSVPHTKAVASTGSIYAAATQQAMFAALDGESQSPVTGPRFRRGTALLRELYGDRVDATGSPLLYTVVAAISSGSFDADAPRYMALSFAALCASVLLLARLGGFGATATLLLLSLVASNFSPVISDVMVGNVNALQLLAVSVFAFCWTRNRPLLAGLAIGLGAAVKPTIALVAVLAAAGVLARGDRRRASSFGAGLAGAVVLGVAISTLYFEQPGIWIDFVGSLARTLGPGRYTIDTGNFSAVTLLFGSAATTMGVLLLVGLTAAGIWLAATCFRTGRSLGDEAFFTAGWGGGIVLLSSPLAWLHYYILILPALVATIRSRAIDDGPPSGDGRWIRQAAGFVPLVLLSASLETLAGDNRQAQGIAVNLAVVLAMGLLAASVWSNLEPDNDVPVPARAHRGQKTRR